jgi:chromosome segregation ATPase
LIYGVQQDVASAENDVHQAERKRKDRKKEAEGLLSQIQQRGSELECLMAKINLVEERALKTIKSEKVLKELENSRNERNASQDWWKTTDDMANHAKEVVKGYVMGVDSTQSSRLLFKRRTVQW